MKQWLPFSAGLAAGVLLGGCARQPEGAELGAHWARGFVEARSATAPVPLVGYFYHGDPKDLAARAEYYHARGLVDGWFEEEAVTSQVGEYFGRGYEDGMKLGQTLRRQSARGIPVEGRAWTKAGQRAYTLGFSHGEAAQAGAERAAPVPPLPTRPSQFPVAWLAQAKQISGVFRTNQPVTRDQAAVRFYQFEFAGDGTARLLTVDSSGRQVGTQPVRGWLTLNERLLTFRPFETEGHLLYHLLDMEYDGNVLRLPRDEIPMFQRVDPPKYTASSAPGP